MTLTHLLSAVTALCSLGIFGTALCTQLPEGSIKKVLQEVDTNLDHRPSQDRVPDFMRELYHVMKDDAEDILSNQSGEDPYTHSPAVKSIRAKAKHGTKFKFNIPESSNLNDLSGAQLIVRTNMSGISAKYRHRLLNLSQTAISEPYPVFTVTKQVRHHEYGNNTRISFSILNSQTILKEDVYLILYEHITAERLHHSRRKRSAQSSHFQTTHLHFMQTVGTQDISRVQPSHCQRVNWTVDFGDLGWFWIMEPLTVHVGMCVGSCTLFTTNPNFTNHAFLRTFYGIQTSGSGPSVPDASCTSTEMSPIMLLYIDYEWNAYTRLLPEFVVSGCGCR